jgi:hypothetical protein
MEPETLRSMAIGAGFRADSRREFQQKLDAS